MRSTTAKIDRDIYSFDEEGRMLHDTWVTSGDNLYYLRSWGGALNTGLEPSGRRVVLFRHGNRCGAQKLYGVYRQ